MREWLISFAIVGSFETWVVNMIDAIGMAYWALRQPFMREPR